MSEILVILHTVKHADNLISVGFDMAADLQKEVRIVYLVETAKFGYYPPHGDPGTFPGNLTYNEALEKEQQITKNLLHEKIEKKTANLFPSPKYTLDVMVGMPDVVLPEYLKEKELVFILIPSSEAPGSEHLLYNMKAFLSSQPVPVLINSVRKHTDHIRKIIYAMESYEKDIPVLKDLLGRLDKKDLSLTLLNVSEKNIKENSAKMNDLVFKNLREIEQVNLTGEDIAEGIRDYLDHHQADLLVILKHNKSFWERMFGTPSSKKIMEETEIPVLFYHES